MRSVVRRLRQKERGHLASAHLELAHCLANHLSKRLSTIQCASLSDVQALITQIPGDLAYQAPWLTEHGAKSYYPPRLDKFLAYSVVKFSITIHCIAPPLKGLSSSTPLTTSQLDYR